MPATPSHAVGEPCWFDLMTSDRDASVEFYEGLFGWKADAPNEEMGGYVNFTLDGTRVAGCMGNPGGGMPDVWAVYLQVDDAAATAAKAAERGSPVFLPAMEVGDLGHMAVLGDPGGAAVGLWQPGTHTGFGRLAEVGAPCWFELFTRDFAPTVSFYEDVFGWDTEVVSDTDEFRYTTLGRDESQRAGIMDATAVLPEGVPAHWSVYIGTTDTDAVVADAVQRGGAVTHEPMDSPYGRMAAITDPTGAQIKLVQVL
jgi:predicted enzyme related to lactoylglutathione lyase